MRFWWCHEPYKIKERCACLVFADIHQIVDAITLCYCILFDVYHGTPPAPIPLPPVPVGPEVYRPLPEPAGTAFETDIDAATTRATRGASAGAKLPKVRPPLPAPPVPLLAASEIGARRYQSRPCLCRWR